jgi:hypothetical protein
MKVRLQAARAPVLVIGGVLEQVAEKGIAVFVELLVGIRERPQGEVEGIAVA